MSTTFHRSTEVAQMEKQDFALKAGRVLLYLGLTFVSITVLRFGESGITFGDIFIFASLVFTILSRLDRSDLYTLRPGAVIITGMLVIGGLLATFSALNPLGSALVLVRILIVAVILPWQAIYLLSDTRFLYRGAFAFALGGGITGAGTIAQSVLGPGVIPGTEITNAGRYTGFAQHVSDTGGITSAALIVAFGLIIAATTRRQRFGAAAVALGAGIGLILSGSVSGLIAVAVGFLIFVIRRAIRPGTAVLIAVAGAAVFWIASAIQAATSNALDPWQRILQTLGLSAGGRYATSEIRASTYQTAVDKTFLNPFGYGLDPASSIVDGTFPAHNLLLAALYQGGLIFAIAILALIVRPFLGRWLRTDPSTLTTAILATAVSAFVFAMTAPSMYNRYFWVPIALLLVARSLAGTTKDPLRASPKASPKGV
ncbi:O-antigen ligase family protein [Herbiconiux solani]|uniref:O-antigen ligase family protein n=1 Tax=Herbiconiux solani TaxID=661329 RepID=UPI0008242495|nr:O-antigen ligase family protein [Herbiconiux solani]